MLVGSVGIAVFGRVRPHRWVPPALSLRVLRGYFERGSAATAASMLAGVPTDDREVRRDLAYDAGSGRDGLFDLVLPGAAYDGDGPPPLVVWMHGGGWYYGRKSDPLPYLELLATRGFAGASLNYPRVPEHPHPAAPQAVHTALTHLIAHAGEYGVDPTRIVLAGDSAGAQVAASAALAWVNPEYAARTGIEPAGDPAPLRGTALFCGTFDAEALLHSGRMFTAILASSMWAQAGTRDWVGTRAAEEITIMPHLTAAFPPTFLRAGNADPLTAGGTVPMAARMAELGLDVDSRIVGTQADPAAHQVQFHLRTSYGQQILEDLVGFLDRVFRNSH